MKHRHHCRHCGRSFCARHLRWRRRLPRFVGLAAHQRICYECTLQLRREDFENRTLERMLRGADFLTGRMRPYLEVIDDSAAAKVRRVGD